MAVFWMQTVLKNEGGYVRFAVDAPFETVDDFARALSDGEIVPMDKIWTVRDESWRKFISGRERIAIGPEYVGMIQVPHEQPAQEKANV